MPYSVFDRSRVLQTALQSLHDALHLASQMAEVEKGLILQAFREAGRLDGREAGWPVSRPLLYARTAA